MPGSIYREEMSISNYKTNLDTILLNAMDGLEVREAQGTLFFGQLRKAQQQKCFLFVWYSRQADNLPVCGGLSYPWASMCLRQTHWSGG